MLTEPHSCHERRGTATQHLVVFTHITSTTTRFIGHMRMNEYNYTHSRSHIAVWNIEQPWNMEAEVAQRGVCDVCTVCICCDKSPRRPQHTLLSPLNFALLRFITQYSWEHYFMSFLKENIPKLILCYEKSKCDVACTSGASCIIWRFNFFICTLFISLLFGSHGSVS